MIELSSAFAHLHEFYTLLGTAGRVEMAGCAIPVLQYELENLAMVM